MAISGCFFKHLAVYTGSVEGQLDPKTRYIHKPKSIGIHMTHGRIPKGCHPRTVTHAISDGVVCMDLGDMLFETDYCVAVRPWLKKEEQQVIVREALKSEGKKYDFDFDAKRPNALFCTELGQLCLYVAGIPTVETIQKRTSLFKKPAAVPIADAFFRFQTVCASESCYNPSFIKQSAYPDRMAVGLENVRER